MQEKSSVRLYKYDNVKFFLIILVAIGHVCEPFVEKSFVMKSIFLYIYIFHMPLFIFISGLFQKKYSDGRKLNGNRVLSFILLGYVCKIVKFLMERFVYGLDTSFHLLSEDGIPWFMFVLAACMSIMYLCRNIRPVYLLTISILIACFVGYDKEIGDFLCLSRIVVYFPFYAMGYYLEPKQVAEFVKSKYIKIASGVVLVFVLYLCTVHLDVFYQTRHLWTGRNHFNQWDLERGGFILRAGCYILTSLIGISVLSLIPDLKIPFITENGKHTIRVYFWHIFIIKFLYYYGFENILFETGAVGKTVLLIIPVLLCFLLSTRLFAFPADYILEKLYK
ncbi:MAG: acyltransferase family protein [Lachnospiraceae bacterium]